MKKIKHNKCEIMKQINKQKRETKFQKLTRKKHIKTIGERKILKLNFFFEVKK